MVRPRWPMQGTRSTRPMRSDREVRRRGARESSSRRQSAPSREATMSTPRSGVPCRRRNKASVRRCRTAGRTRVVLSPRVSSEACVLRRPEIRELQEPVERGCGQHTQVVDMTRIYAWIITSRNSAYKERARIHKGNIPKSVLFRAAAAYHQTNPRANFDPRASVAAVRRSPAAT